MLIYKRIKEQGAQGLKNPYLKKVGVFENG